MISMKQNFSVFYLCHSINNCFDNFMFKWSKNNCMIFNWENHITTSYKNQNFFCFLEKISIVLFTRLNFPYANTVNWSDSNDISVSIENEFVVFDFFFDREQSRTCQCIVLRLRWITFFEQFLPIEVRSNVDEEEFHDPNWPENCWISNFERVVRFDIREKTFSQSTLFVIDYKNEKRLKLY